MIISVDEKGEEENFLTDKKKKRRMKERKKERLMMMRMIEKRVKNKKNPLIHPLTYMEIVLEKFLILK